MSTESPAESPAERSAERCAEPAFPAPPWAMHGSMWLTVLRLGRAGRGEDGASRPAGIYGVAFVSYREPSALTYAELLVARMLRRSEGRGRRFTITDIWVDSPASMAGGRELWAIPKGLCDFDLDSTRRGPVGSTEWSATHGRRPIASAAFTDVSRVAVRSPFVGRSWQPALTEGVGAGGGEGRATMRGTARSLPARARWDFPADGPLAFLRPARALASVRLLDFRMTFG